ncbi:hypothetical protein ACIBOV_30910 [Micromonospora chersina]|uniref:hypothetical protein n=1 Tax=Micromonospora chersina TaxID=47854 RepID=UPI0037A12318
MGIPKEMQRAHARQVHAQKQAQAAAYRHHEHLHREAEGAMKAAQRAAAADERERKKLYVGARVAEIAAPPWQLNVKPRRSGMFTPWSSSIGRRRGAAIRVTCEA